MPSNFIKLQSQILECFMKLKLDFPKSAKTRFAGLTHKSRKMTDLAQTAFGQDWSEIYEEIFKQKT